jgi:NADH-quinone oxidoreductase subunit F
MTALISKLETTRDLQAFRESVRDRSRQMRHVIRICCGPGCIPKGAQHVYERFVALIKHSGKTDIGIQAKATGCQGLCDRGPVVTIDPGGIFYERLQEEDVDEVFQETVLQGRIVERLLHEEEGAGLRPRTTEGIPFYKGNVKIALALCGVIDPESVEDYVAAGGYESFVKVLFSMTPDQVIDEITRSGLRGRGGGGFPTGRKWRSARDAHGEPKYVIANGDEGDPGAFMDRALMEGVPHAVLEGMLIGSFAIGASQGYIYVRDEYPLAVKRLRRAIDQARALGLLGDRILGSGHCFDIRINRGAGAFVCGESTALMASLEGRVGEPRAKYIHTVESGVWGKPSLLNNVETWADVPPIIGRGAAWFASMGTQNSKGTKAFSLVGKIKNTGIIEVPMGMTLRHIIFDIGGGIRDGKAFKAVQTGGPSGGCIPAQYLDAAVDFDELTKLGSMMGSGGIIVMDEDTCMVNVAKYFLGFLKEESCGKCTPCREGIAQMLHILTRIAKGEGRAGDLETLQDLARLLEDTSLCALGKTAANPVLSTIRYFRDEYVAHIRDRRCPAKECPGLFHYDIDAALCTGCGLCKKKCPVQAISGLKKKLHVIDLATCTNCGACFQVCKFSAVKRV